ncbi:hypothetical protein XENOCAPTIV_027031, partial [Xenoophorus captivus]
VKPTIFWAYLKAIGVLLSCISLLLFLAHHLVSLFANYWLSLWTDDPVVNGTQPYRLMRLGVYGGLGLTQGKSENCFFYALGLSVYCALHKYLYKVFFLCFVMILCILMGFSVTNQQNVVDN